MEACKTGRPSEDLLSKVPAIAFAAICITSVKPEMEAALHSAQNHNSVTAHLYCSSHSTSEGTLGTIPVLHKSQFCA